MTEAVNLTPEESILNKNPTESRFFLRLPDKRDFMSETQDEWSVPCAPFSFDGQNFSFLDLLNVKVTARWSDERLLVKLSINTKISVECGRCLELGELAILDDLLYLYSLCGDDNSEEAPDELIVEIPTFTQPLDITDQVWESFYLSLPLTFICKEECLGLCPACGANRNMTSCNCRPESGDPRLEVLGKVFEEPSE